MKYSLYRGKLLSGTYLTVNNSLGHVELSNHTKRDFSYTWLSIIHFTLEHNSVDSLLLCEDLSKFESSVLLVCVCVVCVSRKKE